MNSDAKAEPSLNHFSHPHPLHISNYQLNQTLILPPCSSCNLKASGLIYTCKPCNYLLHIKCALMPNNIKHPFHQHHILSLLPKPISPQGFFNCIACGKIGHGFSYHCKTCNLHVHTFCASMPLSVTHQSHHHNLTLHFSPPYPDKRFSCDLCKNHGSDHWLYRCNSCQFDVHLNCIRAQSPVPQMQPAPGFPQPFMQNSRPNFTNLANQSNGMLSQIIQRLQPQQSQVGTSQNLVQNNSVPNFMNMANQIVNGPGVLPGGINRQSNELMYMNQMIQNMNVQSQAASQQALLNMMAMSGGGGSGGGQNLQQVLMGGGGGGSQDYLQALMSGGGGGQDYLQLLMGGGGGGQDYMQAFMGGGGGGQDYLQAFMGGSGIGDLGGLGGGDGGGVSSSFLDILSGLGGGLGGF